MPSKSKKQGSGPANVSKAQSANKLSQNPPNAANPAKSTDRSVRTPDPQPSARQFHTSDTTEEEPWPAAEQDMTSKSLGDTSNGPTVNRKKQKRRAKEAAKRAEQEQLEASANQSARQLPNANGPNGHLTHPHSSRGPPKGYFTEEAEYIDPDFVDDTVDMDTFYSGGEEPVYPEDQYDEDGFPLQSTSAGKKSAKKNRNKPAQQGSGGGSSTSKPTKFGGPRPHAPPQTLSNAALRLGHKMSRDQIWNTSTQAEKENIKQFWLELGEDDRRSLVKVEKEAVLRKMKEQQKHSCSCTVCGRKRTAIEEELEVLYDAYYVELEQYANHSGGTVNDTRLLGKSRSLSHTNGLDHAHSHYASHGRIEELDDEDLLDEDYDEDDEEDYSDDEDYDQHLPPGPQDFFTFGNSLTVRDGILTVADDLLKNDGKRFIDMMEQLAERRMQREEETRYPPTTLAHHNPQQGHNHPPIDEDDDYDDEEEDEDYDSQEDEDYEADEMDSMTESQRMEEGRRMFQIFAARMFEQRVLTAYREKVARERQRKLLEELDEETRLDTQREAKKAREAAKKKEKKKAQKAAKDEERAKKEAEKTAQEEAAKAAEQKKLEEQKQRKEEQRKKREAERKAQEEERAKKEAEKQRKAAEERERQAEAERKQREAKERDKRKKEEVRKKEREEREAREREAKERRVREDKERKAKEEQAKREKEAAAKVERDTKEQARHSIPQASKRQVVAIPPGLQGHNPPLSLQSPHNAIATPILPKAPTPNRARQMSQQSSQQEQHSHGSSPRSQQAATDNSTSSHSPASIVPPPSSNDPPYKPQTQGPILHHPQPSAPLSPLNASGRSTHLPYGGFAGAPGAGMNGIPGAAPGMPPGMMQQMPMYQGPPMGTQHRNFGLPNGLPFPPGINGARPYHPNQAFHSQAPMPPPTSNPHPPTERNMRSQPHSRHPSGSASFDQISQDISPNPISRPGPIGPSNTTPDKSKPGHTRRSSKSPAVDELATQLGSKALLDDSDVPLSNQSQPPASAPGQPASGRIGFNPFSERDGFHLPGPPHQTTNATWGGAFGAQPPGIANWGPPTSKPAGASSWPISTDNNPPHPPPSAPGNAFSGGLGGFGGSNMAPRANAPRPVIIRLLIAQACQRLSLGAPSPSDSFPSPAGAGIAGDFYSAAAVLRQLELIKSPQEPMPRLEEVLAICDTEGNAQNGGGSFTIEEESERGPFIRFDPDGPGVGGNVGPRGGAAGAPGDIGSPIVGHKEMSHGGGAGFGGPIGGHRVL